MKRAIGLILSLIMLLTVFSAFASIGASAETVISNTSPAIPANVGEKISLSAYSLIFDGDSEHTSELIWKDNSGNEISEFTPDKKGVTALTAESGEKSKTVYVVAKEANETEYVLYEADFSAFSSLDELKNEGWSIATSNARLEDGNLVLGSLGDGYARVFLPAWLGDFGDYSITANAKMLEANDSARWFAIAYRIQNENNKYFPYYHMCIREKTTAANGIEFAERTTADAWNVAVTASGAVASCKASYYSFNVKAIGSVVQYNIGSNEVVYATDSVIGTKTEKAYYKGMIGLTMNYGSTAVKSIKVALQTEKPARPVKKLNLINNAHDKNNLINAIANVQSASGNDFESVLAAEKKPGILLVKASELDDIKAFFKKSVESNVIPTLEVADSAEAEKAVLAVGAAACKDATIISSSAEALALIRSKNAQIRTGLIVDLQKSELSSKEANEIRKAVRSAPATFCVIESENATKQAVSELQELAVAVWVKVDADVEGEGFNVEALKAITSGANGIISCDSSAITAIINEYFDKNAMTRTPVMIGHRGNPSQAPENSLSGFITAYNNGADIFEVDVEITSDGEVIIMHDNTLNRTTNYHGTKSVGQMTLAEVKECFLLAKDGSVSDEKVPTLREVLEEFKGKDCRIFVEFKGSNAKNVAGTAAMIKELDMDDQVDVISFNANFLKQTREELLGMSTGYLLSPKGASGTPEDALEALYAPLNAAQNAFSTVNPSNGVVSTYFMQAATDRGMTVWPWTYAISNNNGAFMTCPDGITTDDMQWVKNMYKSISASNAELKVGASGEISVSGVTYGGETTEFGASDLIVKVISGGDCIEITDGVINGKAEGNATVMFGYKTKTFNASEYILYSQPVTLTVTTPDEPVTEENDYTAIIIAVGAAVVAIAAIVIGVAVAKKKKK